MNRDNMNQGNDDIWTEEAFVSIMDVIKVLIASFFFIATLDCLASGIAVVTNGNFPELRNAAQDVKRELDHSMNKPCETYFYELTGSKADSSLIVSLKSQDPEVIIALGVYAVRIARQTLPDTPIIYTSVRYPEYEGFTSDSKMTGISTTGSEVLLAKIIGSFVTGRADFSGARKLAVMYSQDLYPSVGPLLDRLKQAGLDPVPIPISDAPLLELVMQDISSNYQSLLLLPDKNTQNDYALRFMLTRCMEKRVLTFAFDEFLVEKGVLCGVYAKSDECALYAAVLAKKYLLTGKIPEQAVVAPLRSYSMINPATAKYMGTEPPFLFDSKVK